MKHLGIGATALLLLGSGVGLASASVSTVWQLNAPQGTWLTAAGNNTRTMTFNPVTGNVLVGGIEGGNNIQIINGATGVVSGTPINVTGIAGGAGAALQKVRVVNRGGGNYSVYAFNLITNSRTDAAGYKIYRWTGNALSEDGLGAPTVIYANVAGDGTPLGAPVGPVLPSHGIANINRVGDGVDVVSDGTNTSFYVGVVQSGGALAHRVYRFDYTEGAAAVSTVSEVSLSLTLGTGNQRGIAYDATGNKLIAFSNTVAGEFNLNGTGGVEIFSSNSTISGPMQASSNQPRVGIIGGRKYLGFIDALSSNGGAYRRPGIIDITDGVTQPVWRHLFPNSANANGNGTGDVAFDTTNGRVYALVTGGYVGAYTLDSGSPSTKTWDGGAGDGLWTSATNWSPDGVPTTFNDVVLDNSMVPGAYTVTVSGVTQPCRTLKVGGGASAVTLSIAVASVQSMQLLVVGDDTNGTNDVEVLNNGTISNASGAGTGYALYNLNKGAENIVRNGGTWIHNTARSFGGAFQTVLPGRITFEANSNMRFQQTASATIPFSGRTYGNLFLEATAAKTYTASGSGAANILGNLSIGAFCTFNPSMTGLFNIFGTITNAGSGGTFGGSPFIYHQNYTVGAGQPITALAATCIAVATNTRTLTYTLATLGANQQVMAENGGTVLFPSAITISGGVLLRNGGTIGGAGTISWGTAPFVGTDLATGFPTSALPGFTNTGAYPYPTGTILRYLGPNPQVAGPLVPVGSWAGGIRADTTVTLSSAPSGFQLDGSLNVGLPVIPDGRFGVVVSDTPGTTLTLGTSTAATGTFNFNTGYVDSSFVFRRWMAASAGARDFPLGHLGVRRWCTASSTGQPTTGGTLAIQFLPGSTAADVLITSSPANITKIADGGIFRVTGENGIVFGTDAFNVVLDSEGVIGLGGNTNPDRSGLAIVRRPIGGDNSQWALNGTWGAPSVATPNRLLRNGLTTPPDGDYGFGGSAAVLPVSMSEFAVE